MVYHTNGCVWIKHSSEVPHDDNKRVVGTVSFLCVTRINLHVLFGANQQNKQQNFQLINTKLD